MWQPVLIFLIKLLIGTTLAIAGIYNAKRKKKMRIFDEQDNLFQQAYLEICIRYAKGEISELNLPASTDVIALAVQYDVSFFLTIDDFIGQNLESITAFVGPRPIKRPA